MANSLRILASWRSVIFLNSVIIAAYIAIFLALSNPWLTLASFFLVALLIRCATLAWGLKVSENDPDANYLSFVALNFLGGLVVSAAVVAAIWWLGRFWVEGIKVVVSLITVFVAYKSTFPLPPKQ